MPKSVFLATVLMCSVNINNIVNANEVNKNIGDGTIVFNCRSYLDESITLSGNRVVSTSLTVDTPDTAEINIIDFGKKDADKFSRWVDKKKQPYNPEKRCKTVLMRFESIYRCDSRLFDQIKAHYYHRPEEKYFYPILYIPNSKLGNCIIQPDGLKQNITNGNLLFMMPPQESESSAIDNAEEAIKRLKEIRHDGASEPVSPAIEN